MDVINSVKSCREVREDEDRVGARGFADEGVFKDLDKSSFSDMQRLEA